jgi:hypothetical protein
LGNIKVTVPKDTFDKDVILKLDRVDNVDTNALHNLTAVNFGAVDGTGANAVNNVRFGADKYVTLTLPYPDTDQNEIVDGTSVPESTLRIAMFENNKWQVMTDQRSKMKVESAAVTGSDTTQNTVSCQVNRFGVYALTMVATDPVIENLVVYPNPFVDSVKFMFNVGSQSELKIDVYTLSGRLIKSLTGRVTINQSGPVTIDYDGTDNENNIVADGTYLYKITAVNGLKKNTKIGKLVKTK